MKVIDPTINTLTVRWDPAVGNVRTYKVFYTPQPGGEERMVQNKQTVLWTNFRVLSWFKYPVKVIVIR